MFRYLTKEYWKEFQKTVIVNDKEKIIQDGQEFEKLVKMLLDEMYRSQDIIWEPTQTTHDGSKDFYAHDSKGNNLPLWAECKNYAKKVELKTIAPTIVMVEVNSISEILFFSYSPINDNTKEKLILYADKAGRNIRFYDDINLENLIFKYRDEIFKNYFKGFEFRSNMDIDYSPYIFCKCGTGINISSSDDRSLKAIRVKLNDIFYIGIGIVNHQPCEMLDISIHFSGVDDIQYLEYLDSGIPREEVASMVLNQCVPPGTAAFYPLFFRVSVYKKKLKMPQIVVDYKSTVLNNEKKITIPSILCSNLYVTPLMGSQYRKLVDTFQEKHINQGHLCMCILEGRSGVGKTRMLQEFMKILLSEHYDIIDFTGMNGDTSSIQVIKEILYHLYHLSDELIVESLKEPRAYPEVLGDDTSQILELLQGLTQNKDVSFLYRYKEFVYEKILHSRVGILIDNIQYFDEGLVGFLKNLCFYSKNVNRESKAVFVLTHNRDYEASCTLQEFYGSVFLHKDNFHLFASKYILEGFGCSEPGQALGYLKAIVAVQDESLDYILDKIVATTSGNPKYILEIIEYLEMKHVLDFQDGLLVIQDYRMLEASLKSLPGDVRETISERWDMIKASLVDKAGEAYIILSAIHFWGKCSHDLLQMMSLDDDLLNLLEVRGIVKKESPYDMGYHIFEHDLIEHFFDNQKHFSSAIIRYLIENDLFTVLSPQMENWQLTLVQLYLPDIREDVLYEAIRQIMERCLDIPYKWGMTYFSTLVQYIIKHFKRCHDQGLLIQGCVGICLRIKNVYGTSAALQQYKTVYTFLERELGPERYFHKDYLCFVDGYTENLLHMDATDIVDIYQRQIAALKSRSKQFPDVLGKLYNRIYVYYKDKCPEHEVHRYFLYCQKISEKYNLKELEMLNYFDAGNFFLYEEGQIGRLIYNWERAMGIYKREGFKDAFLFTSKKQIQLCIIKKEYGGIQGILETAQRYLRDKERAHPQSLFFVKHFNVLGAIYFLLTSPDEDKLLFYLSQALEYNVLMNDKKLFNIYFLYAKMHFHHKDYKNMLLYYERSLKNLENYGTLYFKDHLYQIIWEDLKFKLSCIRLEGKTISTSCVQDNGVLRLWRGIEESSEDTLINHIEQFRTISNTSSPDGKDGYIFL